MEQYANREFNNIWLHAYLRPEEFHYFNPSINRKLLDGSKTLWRDRKNFNVIHFGQYQVEIIWPRKIA